MALLRDDLEARARDARHELAEKRSGRQRSSSPTVTSVGTAIAPTRSAVSCSISASAERQNASTDCACGLSAAAVSHSSMIPSL